MAGAEPSSEATLKKILLVVNCFVLAIGTTVAPLVTLLYFIHGGKRIWLPSWLQTVGFPIISTPLTVSYIQRRCRWAATRSSSTGTPSPIPVLMKPFLFIASAVVGLIKGFDNYLYYYGVSRLPVSTVTLIIASQLAFTAGFTFLLVKQRFTPYSINSMFLLTLGAAVLALLALHMGSDRPEGESETQYRLGFVMMVAAAGLYGFILPLVELI